MNRSNDPSAWLRAGEHLEDRELINALDDLADDFDEFEGWQPVHDARTDPR